MALIVTSSLAKETVRPARAGESDWAVLTRSLAVIRTALPAADAVAKLAERFTAKGWIARSPVVDGTTILQHFARTDASRRWDALLMFAPRSGSDQEYDALLDVTARR